MRSCGRHLCLLFALFAVAAPAGDWTYRMGGPSKWGRTYWMCNGDMQSPVKLSTEDVSGWGNMYMEFDMYDTALEGVFTNNGHTVNLDFNLVDYAIHPRVSFLSSIEYYLQSLHFHWPSEHWIDEGNYPLEMHMVHKDPSGEKILVIGYVFVSCKNLDNKLLSPSMTGLDNLLRTVKYLTATGYSVGYTLVPQSIMPAIQRPCDYFLYNGSLTTPPCTEGVTWLVREAPMCVEQWQMEVFYNVLDAHGNRLLGNVRPPQPLNGRTIFLTC